MYHRDMLAFEKLAALLPALYSVVGVFIPTAINTLLRQYRAMHSPQGRKPNSHHCSSTFHFRTSHQVLPQACLHLCHE